MKQIILGAGVVSTPMKRIIVFSFGWRVLLIASLAYTASCADAPSCASLGCPLEPSGSPELWEPCAGATCWCGAPIAEECEP